MLRRPLRLLLILLALVLALGLLWRSSAWQDGPSLNLSSGNAILVATLLLGVGWAGLAGRQRRAEREAHEFNTMSDLAKSLSKLICLISVKTGEDGKMFGAVTSGMIADQLKTQFDVTLDKRKIHLEHPIRAIGDHEVEFRLHAEVVTTLKVRVESTTLAPALPTVPTAESKKEDTKTEKRGKRPEAAGEKPRATDRKPAAAKAKAE